MLFFYVKGGKLGHPETNPLRKARTNNKLNPHMAPHQNLTQAMLVGDGHSYHLAIPALQIDEMIEFIANERVSDLLTSIITPCSSLCTCLASFRQVIHA